MGMEGSFPKNSLTEQVGRGGRELKPSELEPGSLTPTQLTFHLDSQARVLAVRFPGTLAEPGRPWEHSSAYLCRDQEQRGAWPGTDAQ